MFQILGFSKCFHFPDRTYSFGVTSICLRRTLEWGYISTPLVPMLIFGWHFWNEMYISNLLLRPHFLTWTNNIDICLFTKVLWFSRCCHCTDRSYRFWIRAFCSWRTPEVQTVTHSLALTGALVSRSTCRGEGPRGTGDPLYELLHRCWSSSQVEQLDWDPEVGRSSPGQGRTLTLIFLCLSKIQLSMILKDNVIGSSSEPKPEHIN